MKSKKPKKRTNKAAEADLDLNALLNLLGGDDDDHWSRAWDARQEGLQRVLGPTTDGVLHAPLPLAMGGQADVLVFPKFPGGMAYVTADLTVGESGQKPNTLGQFELMICSRQNEPELAGFISRLAAQTLTRKLEVGDVLTLKGANEPFDAVLFCPGVPQSHFTAADKQWGLLLCVGMSKEEAKQVRKEGWKKAVARWTRAGTFPFTTPRRNPCHDRPYWADMPGKVKAAEIKGASAGFLATLDTALERLRKQLEKHDQEWQLATFSRWEISQEKQSLDFTLLNGARVACEAQIIGSHCSQDGSWEWAWNNPHVEKPMARLSTKVKKLGAARKLTPLTTGKLKLSKNGAWGLAALAAEHGRASGVYCAQSGPIDFFVAFGNPQPV